jgi:hypothetical protein
MRSLHRLNEIVPIKAEKELSMPSNLSEFLHFAITLFLATPSQLNLTWIQNNESFDAISGVLADYGFTPDEIEAIKEEIFTPVTKKAQLEGALSATAEQLKGLTFYDGSGVHPNGAQARALVKVLRPIAVTPNV